MYRFETGIAKHECLCSFHDNTHVISWDKRKLQKLQNSSPNSYVIVSLLQEF